MNIQGKKLIVVGGAGLIGSHTVDLLTREDVREIVIYDNFVRGRTENLAQALKDPRVRIHDVGGDILPREVSGCQFGGSSLQKPEAILGKASSVPRLLRGHDMPMTRRDHIGVTFPR